MKRGIVIILAILIITASLPMQALGALMEKGDVVTISEGKELIGNDRKPYFLASGYYTARFSNKAGTGFDYRVCLATTSKNTLVINNGKSKYQGYCLEHGAWMNRGATKYTGNATELKSLYWLNPYSQDAINGIELTLLFGKQPGMSEKDVPVEGCNLDDWYFATQNILWEYQQGLRTSPTSIKSNPKTQPSDWYSKTMKGRPAYKMYRWMLEQMSKYNKPFSFTSKNKNKAPSLKLVNQGDGTWSGVFTDTKNLCQELETTNKHISITREGNKYTVVSDVAPGQVGVVKCTKNASGVKVKQPLLAFTTGQSSTISNHLQSVVWGARDPIDLYFKLGEGTANENTMDAPILPTFYVDIHKRDKNTGFDSSVATGMGDTALNAIIGISVTTSEGTTEDTVELDEYGNGDGYTFQTWLDVGELTRKESKDDKHTYVTYTGHATVKTWEEVVPDGRFTEQESNTGTGSRSHQISYWAKSVDDGPYSYNIQVDGTSYTQVEEDILLKLTPDTYINDLYRGSLQIIKTKTDLDPFTCNSQGVTGTEGSSSSTGGGIENLSPGKYSTKSKWTVRLISEGYEGNPFIRVVSLKEGEKGYDAFAENYKVVRDKSGVLADEKNPLTVSKFGQINIVDLPYGAYRVDEVAADSEGYVLESFVVRITEDGQLISTDLQNTPKTNKIKVVKVNSETGKMVRIKDTAFRIKYLGRPDSENPKDDKNYGKYLPNGSNYTDGKNFVFECDINGQVPLPYPLEYGNYQLEEIVVPEGYYTELDGNAYGFSVTKQNTHTDGEDYETYYVTLNMENNPVKGSVSVEKKGEILSGWEAIKEGIYSLWRAVWEKARLPGIKFEIYAAEDIRQQDGVIPVSIFNRSNGKKIPLTLVSRDHADKADGKEKWSTTLSSGEKINRTSLKKVSDQNTTVTEYQINSAQGANYKEEFTSEAINGVKTSYLIEYGLSHVEGGMNYTNIQVKKTYTKTEDDAEIKVTKPLLKSGEEELEIIDIILPNGNRILQNRPNVEAKIDEKVYIQEYDFQISEHFDAREGFQFTFDDISLSSEIKSNGSVETKIKGFDGVKAETTITGGYVSTVKGGTTVFTTMSSGQAPVYFATNDGIETSMVLSGGLTATNIKVKQSQLFSFDGVYPMVKYKGRVIDWISGLTPERSNFAHVIDENNYLKVLRHGRSPEVKEVYYSIDIISSQVSDDGFTVTYPDTTECVAMRNGDGKSGTLRFASVDSTMIYPVGSPVETITTDEEGKCISSKLPLGKYYIREIEGALGQINSGQWRMFTLAHKDQHTLQIWTTEKFDNRGVKVRINLKKLFETKANSKEYKDGSGAVFGVYTAEDIDGKTNGVKADSLVGVLPVSAGNATATIKLPMGKYYVKELEVPSGYLKDTEKYYFDVKDVLEADKITFHYKDIGIRGKITHNGGRLVRIELDTLYRFPDTVTKITGGKVVSSQLEGRTVTLIESEGESVIVSFENGGKLIITPGDKSYKADFQGTQPVFYTGQTGTEILYEAKVVKTAFRSVATWKNIDKLGSKILEFKSPFDSSKINVVSADEKGTLIIRGKEETVLKVGDSHEMNFGDGVKFSIQVDKVGNLKMTCQGQSDGNLDTQSEFNIDGQTQLPPCAELKHTAAKTYARNDSSTDTISVVIDSIKNNKLPEEPGIVPGKPELPQKGNLELIKRDGNTNKRLSGAEFQLIDGGREIVDTGVTDNKGRVFFANLTPGTYFYHETKAPKGYIRDDEYYRVEVSERKTITINIVNEKEVDEPENNETEAPEKNNPSDNSHPKTGDQAEMPIAMVSVASLMLLGLLMAMKKKSK